LKLRVLTVWFNLTKANLWKQKLGKEGLDHISLEKSNDAAQGLLPRVFSGPSNTPL
jgi:hypothetical protein